MMKSLAIFFLVAGPVLFFTNCKKKESTSNENIATGVVSNLSSISSNYTPNSLDSVSGSSVSTLTDPCEGVTDFAVCQSNLIRAYLQLGKESVDFLSQISNSVGAQLGQLPDGSSGTSGDGKISWNKASSSVWSIMSRGTSNDPLAYLSINGSSYTLKYDMNKNPDETLDKQFEATVTYTDANTWVVDVFFLNNVCDAADPSDPSKAHIKLTKSGGLWSGKAMLYFPRWKSPGSTVTCSTTGSEITMFTDFVGNDTSTKAALYLLPVSVNDIEASGPSNFDIPDFCTNFASSCGGLGEPANGAALAGYPNNWCTTGAGTTPTWGDNCTSNTAVSGASYSAASEWTDPAALKIKVVTLPGSL